MSSSSALLATADCDRAVRRAAHAGQLAEEDLVEGRPGGVGAALGLGVAVVDHRSGKRVVEAPDPGHVVEREAEDVSGDADRERRREVACELASTSWHEAREKHVDPVRDRSLETLANRAHAERLVERKALAVVLVAVARQHHDSERGAYEVRLGPDGELLAPSEDVSAERMARHEPAAERRHPRDGLGGAKPIERVCAGVLLEVGELDRLAEREAPPPFGLLSVVENDLRHERAHRTAASAVSCHHGRMPRSSAIAPAAL